MEKSAFTLVMAGAVVLVLCGNSFGASARCTVVKKTDEVLVMDCGSRAEGFQEGSKVKIKTDRGGDATQK